MIFLYLDNFITGHTLQYVNGTPLWCGGVTHTFFFFRKLIILAANVFRASIKTYMYCGTVI